ncbi:endonuclease/exonuclease/phosphatase family protein [Microbulbifer sp. S227A]|uniref:endonuclease/exonuclease/phosphatase family protein n=1 Tax=Microbulbifer sp. S227A TaxID=3415131 RepID=UPI003C79ED62
MMLLRGLVVCATGLGAHVLPAQGETLRVATFNAELQRDGPGLLYRDLTRGDSGQIAAVVRVIAETAPDILALQGIDWDHDGAALAALADLLAASGVAYPHRFAARPNSGMATDLDLDGDGRLGGPGDAQGFGAFTGQGGLAVLSRHPILADKVRDFSDLIWRDLPGAILPQHEDGSPYPSAEAQAAQRLSNTGHWIVPVALPDGTILSVMTFHANPPVFDGPEDRNGRRNHDEILLWRKVLDGAFGDVPKAFVLVGDANLDPDDSAGRTEAIRALLADTRLQDPQPVSGGAGAMPDQGHGGANARDTVDWDGIGRFRVDYVLPSAALTVGDAGVYWPSPGEPGHEEALAASRHRLVWVDLVLD